MTDKPLVARCEPTVLTLEPGIYWWCACGRSKTQPFCDGTHDITDIKPVKLRLRATAEVARVIVSTARTSRTATAPMRK